MICFAMYQVQARFHRLREKAVMHSLRVHALSVIFCRPWIASTQLNNPNQEDSEMACCSDLARLRVSTAYSTAAPAADCAQST